MNKGDLVNKIAEGADVPKATAERALNACTDAITAALKGGDNVSLVGFGSFKVSQRAARKGRNPQTGAEITIPAQNAVSFKAGSALKSSVN